MFQSRHPNMVGFQPQGIFEINALCEARSLLCFLHGAMATREEIMSLDQAEGSTNDVLAQQARGSLAWLSGASQDSAVHLPGARGPQDPLLDSDASLYVW